jgi:hypothetical protein
MAGNKVVDTEQMERVMSPEALDAYIRVSKPSAWLLTLALMALVTAVIIWGFVGSMPETLSVNGVLREGGTIVCYVDISAFNSGINDCSAKIATADGNTFDAKVTYVSSTPFSMPEIAESLSNDWLTEMMSVDSYGYMVTLALRETTSAYTPDTIAGVTLITGEVKPISLILS